MIDARFRNLPPLLLAAAGLAIAGCGASQTAEKTAAPSVTQVVNIPADEAVAEDMAATETPPEELEAEAPQVAPLAPAVRANASKNTSASSTSQLPVCTVRKFSPAIITRVVRRFLLTEKGATP
jgi:hypothetical protein